MALTAEPRHYGSATDLAQVAVMQMNVLLTCKGCGELAVLDGMALWWHFQRKSRNLSLREIGRHLACDRCFQATGAKVRWPTIELTYAQPTRMQLPIPDERTWKRLVARYRT